jgi:hypothetical protein
MRLHKKLIRTLPHTMNLNKPVQVHINIIDLLIVYNKYNYIHTYNNNHVHVNFRM